jgi:hypothetical protein
MNHRSSGRNAVALSIKAWVRIPDDAAYTPFLVNKILQGLLPLWSRFFDLFLTHDQVFIFLDVVSYKLGTPLAWALHKVIMI